MNRREFVSSSVGALASASIAGAQAGRKASTDPPTGIDFDFTGLLSFHVGKTSQQIRLLLLDALKANLEDVHSPLLMMPYDAWEPKPTNAKFEPYHAPHIVRMGGKGDAMAVWSLVGKRLWAPNAHTTFEGRDDNSNFTFDTSPLPITGNPTPPDRDEGWASLYWFAHLPDLIEGSPKLEIRQETVTCAIRLTRGQGSGRAPKLPCEQSRKYVVGPLLPPPPERTFGTQFHVVYEHPTPEMHLGISPIDYLGPRIIAVKVDTNKLTPVTILNLPQTHRKFEHYKAFYSMVGTNQGKEIRAVSCPGEVYAHEHTLRTDRKASEPASPDPDCIPPFTVLD